jgi:myo-inositol 2-dehydrogenase/D-chiro-inositol 1-dehydrogenase
MTIKEFRNVSMTYDPQFAYLSPQDRYVLTQGQPRYRFNVIGVGVNGQEHIRVTHLEGRATIKGVYDPHAGSVKGAQMHQAHFAPHQPELVVYDTLEAACADPDVDGLIIATPNYTHLEVVKVAAQSGKHILLEKPIATTIADAAAITQIAESYPAVFQIGLQYRYKAGYVQAIHEALERRTLGEIKLVQMQEHRMPFLDKVGQWNKFSQYSGNTLVEKCCHYFDLMNLFAGARPVEVYAVGSQAVNFKDFRYNGQASDILDNAFAIVRYANGVQANFSLCMFAPMFYEELVICGDEGRLKAWENADFRTGALEAHIDIACGAHRPSFSGTPAYPKWIETSGHGGATYYEHVSFIDRIEGRPTRAATAREGLWSVIVASAAQESIQTGQPVRIDDVLAREQLSL